MNYMGNANWWNNRFQSRSLNLMKHEKTLEEDLQFLQGRKTILDIASGDGRNAIYLAKLGFEIEAIDFSFEALKRLNYFANRENLKIKTELMDISKDDIIKLIFSKRLSLMNYMGNANWWNNRFQSRSLNLMKHEKTLEEDLQFFQGRKIILDIASGDGRNAIYLAKLGFEIEAIDFSFEALKRLNYFANRENFKIKTELMDLSKDNITKLTKKYDAIIINHYRLPQKLYVDLINSLNSEGILWVNGFSELPEDNPNIKESDLLYDEDFKDLNPNNFIDKKEYEINNNRFVRYIWKK